MQLPTMLSAAVHSLHRDLIPGLVSATFTDNNLNFLGLFTFLIPGLTQLSLALKSEPYPGPWYRLTLYIIVAYYIGLRFAMQAIIPNTPQDVRHFFSAIRALFTELSTDTETCIRVLGIAPCQLAIPFLSFFRRPTLGARSCPWAVWTFWCYGCHYLVLANLHLAEPERNPIICSSVRYILGMGMLAGLYHKLQLFSPNKLLILLATVPVSSHIVGKFWGEVLQGMACPAGLRPYLVGYALATILASSLYFWNYGDLGASMDPDLSEKHCGDKRGGL